ncbi:Detected protein of unknown function [Hibiscus syriacus]|uniref:Uncharacterized protein n=1 Tax=Hibiscus syriacus TaxID=106335 RepID=A0A6A2XF14_HIBSY|nr:Detected protein of unknown function [Hibiscus syriacus]
MRAPSLLILGFLALWSWEIEAPNATILDSKPPVLHGSKRKLATQLTTDFPGASPFLPLSYSKRKWRPAAHRNPRKPNRRTMPSRDDAFKKNPVNFLNERTFKGIFFGNYKPRSDIPGVVERYIKKELELDKFITHPIPFGEINKACDYMLAAESLRCVVRMDA